MTTTPKKKIQLPDGRFTSKAVKEPIGVAGRNHPVELPAVDGGMESGARTRCWLRRRPEACGSDLANSWQPLRMKQNFRPAC
ncbi:hypothetical protein [Paraburkholderia youngii]|uniref:hypothetical protein n=1 Tax=Paraburkholderia TaxID=1822464 RepID=UPI003D1EF103